jgi:hypothetical protein
VIDSECTVYLTRFFIPIISGFQNDSGHKGNDVILNDIINMMKRFCVITFLILSLLIASLPASGCTGNTSTTTDTGYEIRLAPIHDVKISIAKSLPPQIIVSITGGLSDGCTTFDAIKTSRSGDTITITVTTRHPRNTECPAIYGYFEQMVNLGSDFTGGNTYTLKVNEYTTMFEYPI